MLLVVKLDNAIIGAGPGTVIAHVDSVKEFLTIATDRDGARDRKLRLWVGDNLPVGSRVVSKLIRGTGLGVTVSKSDADPGVYASQKELAR